jgi:hypothetical protein
MLVLQNYVYFFSISPCLGPDAAPLAEDVEYPELSGSETSGPESSGLRASGPKSSGPESSGLRASLTGDPGEFGGSEETDPEVTGSGKAKSASLEVKPDEGQQRVTKKPRGPGVSNSYLPPVQVSNFVHFYQSYFFCFSNV